MAVKLPCRHEAKNAPKRCKIAKATKLTVFPVPLHSHITVLHGHQTFRKNAKDLEISRDFGEQSPNSEICRTDPPESEFCKPSKEPGIDSQPGGRYDNPI